MIRTLILFLAGAFGTLGSSLAQTDLDEIVRLPGQGEVRSSELRDYTKSQRLKPGAGLFIAFDRNQDGRVNADEIASGIPIEFTSADSNNDGFLTALEQQAWAAGLPTRDDSLANPFRFDPNLDRRVDIDEFTLVINNLGNDYRDEQTGDIIVADLRAPQRGQAEARQDRRDSQRDSQRERVERRSRSFND